MITKKLVVPGLLAGGVAAGLFAGTRPSGEATPENRFSDEDVPSAHVYKSPTCGCCAKWVTHLEAAGFAVTVEDVADMNEVKRRAGVPGDLASCHTAWIGDYVVEGHVPARVIQALLNEAPDVAGLAVPGMPIGSPGMEGRNPQPYDVIAFDAAGNRGLFERIEP